MAGSATALTSATERPAQSTADWKAGLGSTSEQPEPGAPQCCPPSPSTVVAFHTDSPQPRALPSRTSEVPPTAVTYGEEAG